MKLEKNIVRYRVWFIVLPLVLTIIAVFLLTKMKINSDLESYFPEQLPSKINAALVGETFGKADPLMLIFESEDVLNPKTLERIQSVHDGLTGMDCFDEVISLFDMKSIDGEEGMMVVNPLIEYVPENEQEIAQLREKIRGNDLAWGTVISKDYRYTLILLKVAKNFDDSELISSISELLKKYPGEEKTYLNGLPYLRNEANLKISRDLTILLPLGLLIMILFLLFSFREFRGVWLPISVVVVSTVVSMSMLPLMNWDLSIIGVLIPIMMIAIANNYGVHFISRYQEMNAIQPRISMHMIVVNTLHHLKKPVIFTGLTTIVGILGLATHLMIPARQMGVISALGVGMALALSLTFIPACLSLMKKGKPQKLFNGSQKGTFGYQLASLAKQYISHPWRIIILFSVLLLAAGSGIVYLKVASNNDKVLPSSHPYNQSIEIANHHFGGTRFLSVLFDGDMQDPGLLERLNRYEKELKEMPGIGSVTSMSTVIRIMSRALNDAGTEGYDKIPATRDAIAQYLLLYSMSGDPDDFESLVSFDYTKGLLNIQFQAEDMKSLKKVINRVDQITRNDPARSVLSGFSLTDREMARSITTGQVYSLLFALVAIFLLLTFIFKSVTAGLLGTLPLLFSVVCTFGVMGFLGFELNIVTALLSSISIGVGVDYTIHLFWRLKTELARGETLFDAMYTTLQTTGRGITINALSVILGFSVLFFSSFPYLKMFATLIILSLTLCLVCALVLIPALCILMKPGFLSETNNNNTLKK